MTNVPGERPPKVALYAQPSSTKPLDSPFWSSSTYEALLQHRGLFKKLFVNGRFIPFTITLSNPFSFLFTLGVFCHLYRLPDSGKVPFSPVLVPLVRSLQLSNRFLVVPDYRYTSKDIAGKLDVMQRAHAIQLVTKSRLGSEEGYGSMDSPSEEELHRIFAYLGSSLTSLTEESSSYIQDLGLCLDPSCVTLGAYTPRGLYNDFKGDFRNFVFPAPNVAGLSMVEESELGDPLFFKSLEHKVYIGDIHPDDWLKQVATYQKKMGIPSPSPGLTALRMPERGERLAPVFMFFPKTVGNEYFYSYVDKLPNHSKHEIYRYDENPAQEATAPVREAAPSPSPPVVGSQ